MRGYLLDTHVLLWWADDHPRLAPKIRRLIEDGSQEVWVSAVSCWEASIKAAQGKLQLPLEPQTFFQQVIDKNHFLPLPIHISHAAGVFALPKVHGDPFDRLLIAQARAESLAIISEDAVFQKYDLPGLVTGS